jgi:hypothetical protein
MNRTDDYDQDDQWLVYELRQYTLRPGQRDVLIDLFDREFVETQEAVGIRVVGQFRDREHPNRFVWIRGFRDMPSRAQALTDFYGGPVWKEHRHKANATMIDTDDVLLLRPVSPGSGFPTPHRVRPPAATASPAPQSIVTAMLCYRDAPVDDAFVKFFTDRVQPVLLENGAQPLACLKTEPADNDYPALPVRSASVFVWFTSFANPTHYHVHAEQLDKSQVWQKTVLPDLLTRLASPPQHLRLAPTARSLLR